MPFTLTMPKLSPTMEEGTLVKWRKAEGDRVLAGDLIIEVATDKATVEHHVLDGGWLRKILVKAGAVVKVNEPIAIFTETQEESIEGYQPEGISDSPVPEKKEEPAAVLTRQASKEDRVIASPLAKKLAKQQGIDLHAVQGTGPQGRITSRDLGDRKKSALRLSAPSGSFSLEPLTPMRKVIAQRLQESKSTIPHFYETQAVRVDHLMRLRHELNEYKGWKISYNDLVLRAVALALEEHPKVNSGFDVATQSIIRFHTIDLSVAVSLESGLITPIIRNANEKSLPDLSSEMKALAVRAREGRLKPEEYVGGSFTISNIGMFGIAEFKAIINPPQAAILAVGGILEQPVVQAGKIEVGHVMCLTLSADHRVLDGTDVAKFLNTLQKLLEHPSLLLLAGTP